MFLAACPRMSQLLWDSKSTSTLIAPQLRAGPGSTIEHQWMLSNNTNCLKQYTLIEQSTSILGELPLTVHPLQLLTSPLKQVQVFLQFQHLKFSTLLLITNFRYVEDTEV